MRTPSLKASAWAIATSSVLLLAIPAESSVVYRVPYENGGRSYASAIYLEVPVQTIEKPWPEYREATGSGDDAEQALRELLQGIYARQFDRVEARVAATAIRAIGGVQKYVDGFRASLPAESNLRVVGKLSGADVRFILRDGGGGGAYKLLRFSKADGARFVLDQMKAPGQIDRLLSPVLRLAASEPLEAASSEIPRGSTAVNLSDDLSPPARLHMTVRRVRADPSGGLSNASAPITFFRGCIAALKDDKWTEFLDCFGPDEANRLRGLLDGSPKYRQSFVELFSDRLPLYEIDGGVVDVLVFDDASRGSRHHGVIVSGSRPTLANPLASGTLDQVLDDRSFRAELRRLIAN
jgi:hypothetical protein